jgi:DnaJ-class molecular chaperone
MTRPASMLSYTQRMDDLLEQIAAMHDATARECRAMTAFEAARAYRLAAAAIRGLKGRSDCDECDGTGVVESEEHCRLCDAASEVTCPMCSVQKEPPP